MSYNGPRLIQPFGPFQGSPQGPLGQPNQTNGPPTKDSTGNAPVGADEVELNLDVQREIAAAQARGRALIGLDPQAQSLAQQAQVMVGEGQLMQGKRSQEMLDAVAMFQRQWVHDQAIQIGNREVREADKKKKGFATEAIGGFEEGKQIEQSGNSAAAGEGSGGGGGGGGNG